MRIVNFSGRYDRYNLKDWGYYKLIANDKYLNILHSRKVAEIATRNGRMRDVGNKECITEERANRQQWLFFGPANREYSSASSHLCIRNCMCSFVKPALCFNYPTEIYNKSAIQFSIQARACLYDFILSIAF